MKKSYYIIGTDTGCGKTLIAGATAAWLRQQGRDVGVMKPFESACEDSVFLKEMSGSKDSLDLINPYRFEEPLAPGVAAERLGVSINLSYVIETFRTLQNRHDVLIAEGAGGLMVPLSGHKTHIDLLRDLKVSVIVVARLGLGTINHTLMTFDILRQHEIRCEGVILNEIIPQSTLAEKTNPDVLKRYYQVPLLGIFPYLSDTKEISNLSSAIPNRLKALF